MAYMKRWYYRFPGDVYAFGPTEHRYSAKEIRAKIREWHGLARLPRGTEIWALA